MQYRVLVTGSRTWSDDAAVFSALDEVLSRHPVLTVVHGANPRGADAMADRWARDHDVHVERHPAEWDHLGKSAGMQRNQVMVESLGGAGEVLAFIFACTKPGCRTQGPHGSHGTMDCVIRARRARIPVREWVDG